MHSKLCMAVSSLGVRGMNPILMVKEASGEYRLASPEEILNAANNVIESKFQRGVVITGAKMCFELFTQKLALREREVFAALFLDERHRVLVYEELFLGTVNGAVVYPRILAQKALGYNAAALVVAHNHPSGDPEPSEKDKQITAKLIEALALIDVRLIDHIVVGDGNCVSFAEYGFI